ncbi:MAG: FAD-dependent oxidoreductase [Desulfobacula sp.]|nr:FAD-dependent oxidoreductase [Desulfobacula sp.]
MKKTLTKILTITVIAIALYLFFSLGLQKYLTLEYIKSQQLSLEQYYSDHTMMTIAGYMAIYIIVTALSLPGAAVMTIAGGALFGIVTGVIAVSFASAIGATLAFLASRFLLRDYVQNRFGEKIQTINREIKKDGVFYLFTLRLIPLFPFFVINLVMGLAPISTIRFFLVSQAGMLAGTIVYVNAGTQLSKIESLGNILSPGLIFSFVLLGLFPIAAKKLIEFINGKKIYAPFKIPKTFDYNLVVIGAGSAGLVTSLIAAVVKSKVALIEKHKMGGDCLNTGCVPSKALIRSAKMLSHAKRAKEFGFNKASIDFTFDRVMARVHKIIKKIEPHDSIERFTDLGVDCIQGEAKIVSPFKVKVNDKTITTRSIVIATGAKPFIPHIKGIEKIQYLTSDTIWDITKLPKKLLVLGGGPIGAELAQTFGRFGSSVVMIVRGKRILAKEDIEISQMVKKKFEDENISVLTEYTTSEIIIKDNKKFLVCRYKGEEKQIEFDEILLAVGRKPNTKGFGLEDIGVTLTQRGAIEANQMLQTNFPNIFCAGDVTGPYQFTHTAAHQAWYASVNALFGRFKKYAVDYRVIPWATYTDPEVARVGLNEQEASLRDIDYEVTTYGIDELDRAICDSEDHGVVKILTKPNSDQILGVTIAGSHAGDLIAEYVLAMKHNLGLNKILKTIHIYPTLAEANKYAAGNWKKKHAPKRLLNWIKKYHTWMRS